jgi:hypothetical protein
MKVKVLLSVHDAVKTYGGVEVQLFDPDTRCLHVVSFTPWLLCHRYVSKSSHEEIWHAYDKQFRAHLLVPACLSVLLSR